MQHGWDCKSGPQRTSQRCSTPASARAFAAASSSKPHQSTGAGHLLYLPLHWQRRHKVTEWGDRATFLWNAKPCSQWELGKLHNTEAFLIIVCLTYAFIFPTWSLGESQNASNCESNYQVLSSNKKEKKKKKKNTRKQPKLAVDITFWIMAGNLSPENGWSNYIQLWTSQY